VPLNQRDDEADDGGDFVLDAVAALRSHGHIVEAAETFERWCIDGGDWISLGAMLALAMRLGLREGPGRAQ
jgi:hypothetical protein